MASKVIVVAEGRVKVEKQVRKGGRFASDGEDILEPGQHGTYTLSKNKSIQVQDLST